MQLTVYRDVLSDSRVRSILLLSLVVKIPIAASGIILTLHVVTTLQGSYAAAGLVTAVSTLCLAISAPWRGRMLDRVGLRNTVLPSIVMQAVCWSIAPWFGYQVLIVMAALGGLFIIPVWAVIRQALMARTDPRQRKAVLSIDSSITEICFMIGPALGTVAALNLPTRWVLFGFQMLAVAGGVLLWCANPRLTAEGTDHLQAPERIGTRRLLSSLPLLAVFVSAGTASAVLVATDVGIVAALRDMGHEPAIAWVMTLWAGGSLIGGLAYGAWHRSLSVFSLLFGLALFTAPVAFASQVWFFALLVTACGVLCAPTIVATVDAIGRLVPEQARGEAIGWHASFMTVGQAAGAPLAGYLIDHWGASSAFLAAAVLGVLVAGLGWLAARSRRARRARVAVLA